MKRSVAASFLLCVMKSPRRPCCHVARTPLLALALAAVSHPAYSQTGLPTRSQPPAAAQACVACHGAHGEGNPTAGFPRIAGQSQYYIARQLESYVNGSRRNAVMEPIAKSLSPEIRAALARYYAQIDAPAAKNAREPRKNERGRTLALQGDAATRVQACINCHGPGGVGEPPAIPYLAGLDANYITSAMNSWKDGTRRNDAGQQMATVAKAMTAEDVTAVAHYYASLPPPKASPLNLVQAPAPARKPVAGTTPSTPQTTQTQPGVGVEQGAPMGGGTHGEGAVGESKGASARGAQAPGGSGTATRATGAGGTEWPGVIRPPQAGTPVSTDKQPLRDADPARGRALVASGAYGCAGCHAISDIRSPRGIVGPPLGGVANRPFIAGQLPNKPDVLVAFLQNPPALIPKTGMPNVGLSAQQARDIAAFLSTLEP